MKVTSDQKTDDAGPICDVKSSGNQDDTAFEFVKEYVEAWELGMAGDSSLLKTAKKIIESRNK